MYWPRFATALTIAAHLWGQPACGTPQVVYRDVPPADGALAYPDLCLIVLDRSIRWSKFPEWRCTLIVHEWGHLTGHDHSTNPADVMYAYPRIYWRCIRPGLRASWDSKISEISWLPR